MWQRFNSLKTWKFIENMLILKWKLRGEIFLIIINDDIYLNLQGSTDQNKNIIIFIHYYLTKNTKPKSEFKSFFSILFWLKTSFKCWILILKENRINIRAEFSTSFGMNFVSTFQPEREFKMYKSCKCSQNIIWFIVITENHCL